MAATLSLAAPRETTEPEPAPSDGAGSVDRAQFEQLYRTHFAFVWRTLRRFGVADATLEDVTQEVFLVALRRADVWLGDSWSSPRAWLFGVARRVAADHRRSRDRHTRKLAAVPELDGPRPVDERLDDHARLNAVALAIAALTPDRRAVYVLAELEDLSAPEIAEALELKLNTVYSKLRRARRDVARSLAAAGHPLAVAASDSHQGSVP